MPQYFLPSGGSISLGSTGNTRFLPNSGAVSEGLVVPSPPGGGGGGGAGGGGGGGNHGGGSTGGGGSHGTGGGKGTGKQKAISAKAWAKGYFSTTWIQVIARRRNFAVVANNVTPTPTPDQNTRPTGGARHKPIKFRGRFYHPEKDRYALAQDVQAWLAEKPAVADEKPVKVKVKKKTVVLPAVELTPEEMVDFEAVARELNLKHQAVLDYVNRLRELSRRIEMEDEAEAIALLLVA